MSTATRVVKNTTFLLAGSLLSDGLGLVYVSVLARYVHAAGMGKIGTATSLVSMLILVVNFGIGQLITRDIAADRDRAATYVPNAAVLRLFLSFLFAVVVVAITGVSGYPSDTALIVYIYAFGYVFDMLTDIAFSVFQAFERMEYMAALQTGRNLTNITLSLVLIYFRAGLIAVVLASTVASLLKLVMSLVVLRRRFVKPKLAINASLCRSLLRLSLPFAGLVVVNVVDRSINTYLLSLYRPETEVGWFSGANTLITYLLLVPNMLNQAIFPVFARLHGTAKESLAQAYSHSFRYLVVFGFALCVGIVVTADRWIALLYGPGFENAAVPLRILAFLLFTMLGFANGALLGATGGQVLALRLAWAGLIVNVATALFLIPRSGLLGASVANTIGPAIFFVPVTWICHRRLGMRLPVGLVIKTLVSSLIMGLCVALSLRSHINLFVCVFVIAPAIYSGLLLVLRVISREDVVVLAQIFRRQRPAESAVGTAPRN